MIDNHNNCWCENYDLLIVSFSDGPPRKTSLLNQDCVTWIRFGMSVFRAVLEKLLSGAITVLQFQQLLEENMKTHFLDLLIIIERLSESGIRNVPECGFPEMDICAVLDTVLVWRQTELHSFEEYCLKVNHLQDLCAGLRSG